MRKQIWIWNHYAGRMFFAKGGRHYWFAKYLSKLGYKVTVFCASSLHDSEKNVIDGETLYIEKEDPEYNIRFIFVKTRNYSGNGLDRVFNMIDFYKNILKVASKYIKREGRVDAILASSVHPLTLVAGIRFAKKQNLPCICEVRDLWPKSIVAYSNRFTERNILIKLLYKGEYWIYKKADALIFTMEGGADYLKAKGWLQSIGEKKVFYINNGVDLEAFEENRSRFKINDKDLEDDSKFKIVYTGSIRKVNNVGFLLECAKELQNRKNDKVKFVIYGGGNELESLKQKVKKLQLHNILFKGRVDKQYVPDILSKSDLNVITADKTVEMVSCYGMSPNKLFEYLASGKPILCSFSEGRYSIIEKNCVGIAKPITNPKEYCDIIDEISNYPRDRYLKMCSNSRKTVEKYSFKKLTDDLVEVIKFASNYEI